MEPRSAAAPSGAYCFRSPLLRHGSRWKMLSRSIVRPLSSRLASGPVIRLERVAVNRASFEMPDNDGQRPLDESVDEDGPVARAVTLPVGKIIASLRDKGIPARISDTAGTFLCNATLYRALGACEQLGTGARCGFIHLPYLPQQVSELLSDLSNEGRLELHQRADLASMSFDMMLDAVRTTLALSLEQG
jgi:pyroglutamyl-peptidase